MPGRRVVAARARARITEARGDDGEIGAIEGFAIDTEPYPQAVPARVVPGDAGVVHAPTRRLAHDQDTRALGDLDDRARATRQITARATRAHLGGERLQGR